MYFVKNKPIYVQGKLFFRCDPGVYNFMKIVRKYESC